MTLQEKIKYQLDVVHYFKEVPFYNKHVEKPKSKSLKNIDLLSELPFYEELNIIKKDRAFRRYALQSWSIWIKDPLIQLELRKSSIKDLFSDLLVETKGFKYQITGKALLKKH